MERFVTLSTGVRMQYVEQGPTDGLPVVFLHGVTDSWRSFERVLPLLPAEIHAFALSARGHGDSSRPDRGYLIADVSEDLQAFMDATELERAVVVGHSMGALVAQRFVVDHPERVLGLVLMGAFATLFQDPVVTDFYESAIVSLADPIDATFVREWQESTLARPIPADHFETIVTETLKVPARVWRQAFDGFLSTPDFSGELTRVAVPCLITWGDKDTYTLRASQDRLVTAIPGARLVTYEGGGHAFHWEEPARFVADLTAFLTNMPDAAHAPKRGAVRLESENVGPVLGGWLSQTRQSPKASFDFRGLVDEFDTRILEPSVVGRPCLRLGHDFVVHHNPRSQQTQQAELREPAESEARICGQRHEPLCSSRMMGVPFVGERHPDVDVREKRGRRWWHCRELRFPGAWTERSVAIRRLRPSGARP
jgi:non-heme chloroperoxidase